MILIVSSESDLSTNDVLRWLTHFDADFIRVNEDDKVEVLDVKIEDNLVSTLKIKDQLITSDVIRSVWFRRGYLQVENYHRLKPELENKSSVESGLSYSLATHSLTRQEVLNHILQRNTKINVIGRNAQGRTNKLINLNLAVKLGLEVPRTLVTTSKSQVLQFMAELSGDIITKSLDLNFSATDKTNEEIINFHQYTALVNYKDVNSFPSSFGLTLFQENLSKVYEVRTFFLNGTFFSQAIFSQNNCKTLVDSRRYDTLKRNRVVPITLPEDVKHKIKELMDQIEFESGSIDFVKTKEGKLIFLEVNPVGQFGHLSLSCNYQIEKYIAKTLLIT